MEELKPQIKPEIKTVFQEPWIKAGLDGGKFTPKELGIYEAIAERHKKIARSLPSDADEAEAADQSFLRHAFNEMGVKHGLSESAVKNIYFRLHLLNINYRPPPNTDFSPEAIERNMPRYLEYYQECKRSMIIGAAMQRNYAVSHRPKPFRVGCTALTLDADLPDDQPAIHPGANYKPTKESITRCAEKHAIEGAILYNTKLIIAIIVVSKETTTGDPSQSCGALHPCLECRKMYRDLLKKGILREDSIICSANDAEVDEEGMPTVIEEMSVKELLDLYKDDPEE